jgi:large subunit ribosomal protein L32
MGLPKRRTSSTKRNKRRAHDALVAPQSISCPQCGERTLPHRACRHCGTYRGRQATTAKDA